MSFANALRSSVRHEACVYINLKAGEYQIVNRDTVHPVTRGLPEKCMYADDIIINGLKGPAQNVMVLSTVFSDSLKGRTGRHEPILFTVEFGEGRIFQTAMGYTVNDEEKSALEYVGFITVFQRGTEWAATGSVIFIIFLIPVYCYPQDPKETEDWSV